MVAHLGSAEIPGADQIVSVGQQDRDRLGQRKLPSLETSADGGDSMGNQTRMLVPDGFGFGDTMIRGTPNPIPTPKFSMASPEPKFSLVSPEPKFSIVSPEPLKPAPRAACRGID